MKKFKFFALAFAALSFAACSDDVIDGKGGNTGTGGDATPAYLTISFTANSGNSSRSTADDANNYGDQDGDAEDSGHSNAGTADENAVYTALIVVNPADGGNTGYAKLYSTAAAATEEDDKITLVDNTNKLYKTNPIEVAEGRYNVLVVINPVNELLPQGINEGIGTANTVQDLYNKIINESYLPDVTAYNKLAAGTDISTEGLMMASKDLNNGSNSQPVDCSVVLDATNTPENPAHVFIDVERVMSKITFRDTEIDGMIGKNIYPVTVHTGVGTAATVRGAILDETTEPVDDYRIVVLNEATDLAGHTVYALYEKETPEAEATLTGVYGATETIHSTSDNEEIHRYTKLALVTDTEDYVEGTNYVGNSSKDNNGLTLVLADMGDPTYWYVKLEGYALVNLSKDVHYVRHTIDDANNIVPFGTLNGSNYLYTTNWGEKNNAQFETNNGEVIFTNCDPNDWFYNTLKAVSDDSKELTFAANGSIDNSDFYQNFPTGEYPTDGTVSGDGTIAGSDPEKGQHTSANGNLDNIGHFLTYCFENSTDVPHQMHGISTGISFVARMYTDKDCTQPVERLYQYAGQKFTSLKNIQDAFGASRMSEAFNALVTKEEGGTDITEDDLKELAKTEENIIIYHDNTCYYYTTEIKHFDNGDNAVMGNMEFAIMRNNIYSLSVSDINEIGDPFVDPTPNIPDETENRAALDVTVHILPWIVRYNNIEF